MKQGSGLKRGKGLDSRNTLSNGDSSLGGSSQFKRASKKMNGKSSKQNKIDKDLTSVYKAMDQGDECWCTGCGSTENLSHSHLIPRSERRDLTTDPNNITYHCDKCHDIWEHGKLSERMKLKGFKEYMRYIFKADFKFYQKIMLNK